MNNTTSRNWMPILGEFDTTSEVIVFKGKKIPVSAPAQPELQPQPEFNATVGILLSDGKMINGHLSAVVTFDEITQHSQCELVIGFDVGSTGHVSAGLGGGGALFSIREWVPPPDPKQGSGAWKAHVLTGDRSNLKPMVPYEISVRATGSNVVLRVNGVEVATATLASSTTRPRQIGIFCLSISDIQISKFAAEFERPKAFIVMQFSSPYNEVYSHVIKNACDDFDIEAIRADEIYGPGIIIKDVIDRIAQSQVVIADISPTNPNVYFEVGYALALGKPIILLAQRRTPETPLPFDLSAFRVLFYDDSIGGKPKLETGLRNHLREILGRA